MSSQVLAVTLPTSTLYVSGTVNGKDGKPFKTREGGVMRLEVLIDDIRQTMLKKITDNHETDPDEAEQTSKTVALAAIKYGDLSNQASKDYVFDLERFTSFEGNTGPYILYTIVRIKSILEKAGENGIEWQDAKLLPPEASVEKSLMLDLTRFGSVIGEAYEELAPHKICAYIYDTANDFNRFYHETKILSEPDEARRSSYLKLLYAALQVLEKSIDILGFCAPDHM